MFSVSCLLLRSLMWTLEFVNFEGTFISGSEFTFTSFASPSHFPLCDLEKRSRQTHPHFALRYFFDLLPTRRLCGALPQLDTLSPGEWMSSSARALHRYSRPKEHGHQLWLFWMILSSVCLPQDRASICEKFLGMGKSKLDSIYSLHFAFSDPDPQLRPLSTNPQPWTPSSSPRRLPQIINLTRQVLNQAVLSIPIN